MTPWRRAVTPVLLTLGLAATPAPLPAQAPKFGGVLTPMQREELPQGLSIIETSTIANLVPHHSLSCPTRSASVVEPTMSTKRKNRSCWRDR